MPVTRIPSALLSQLTPRYGPPLGGPPPSLPPQTWLLAILSLAAFVAVFFVPRIPQDPAYHRFVDARTLLGVPNFWNVVSNVGYLVVGLYWLARVSRLQASVLRPAYITFCVAVTVSPLRSIVALST